METILNFLFSQPSRVREIGILIMEISGGIGIIGLIGRVMTTVVNMSIFTKLAQPEKHLADVITGIPTFWIPESPEGFGMAGCVFVIGLAIALMGKDIERKLKY